MQTVIAESFAVRATPPAPPAEPPFGVNEMRLSARQWAIAFAIVLACAVAIPRIWKKTEPFVTGPDYRVPYALSKDYWLYQRRLEQDALSGKILLIGDSVVWGEYVLPDGTLSHFLNQQAGQGGRFLNCGVNGLFPLAMEGLVQDYGQSIRRRKVIVQCNVLWMTSPKADLSQNKEDTFNHSHLTPQFEPRIPCYRADANERLGIEIERHVQAFAWVNHLQIAYYDQHSIPQWTLGADDSTFPPTYPNAWRNPLAPLKLALPAEPVNDSERGPASSRHKPWNAQGAEPTRFDWVTLDKSLQWQAFQRVVDTLRSRENDVLVIVGPFNEHMIADDQRAEFHLIRDTIAAKLSQNGVAIVVPETLPAQLYADASHPLTEGYEMLAQRIFTEPQFKKWLAGKGGE